MRRDVTQVVKTIKPEGTKPEKLQNDCDLATNYHTVREDVLSGGALAVGPRLHSEKIHTCHHIFY